MNGTLARLVATSLTLGERLPAPGTTAGSAPALAAFALVAWFAPESLALVAVIGCVLLPPLSVWASGCECRRCGAIDPRAVVIDEVMGQWVALSVVLLGAPHPGPLALLAAFFLFRALDVIKPWPISALERLPGGWGVSLDDLAAGLVAGAVTAVGAHLLAG